MGIDYSITPPTSGTTRTTNEIGLWTDLSDTIADINTRIAAYEADTTAADHIADTSDAHDASAVSFTPTGTIAATNVQDAIVEAASEGGGGGGTTLKSASAALSAHTPNNTTMEQWATEVATVVQADAPSPSVVVATLTGSMGTSGTAVATSRGEYRLEVSFDGGATWAALGDAGSICTVPSTTNGTRQSITATGRATGTPTGDVKVRAMCRDVDTANTTVYADGVIVMLVHS